MKMEIMEHEMSTENRKKNRKHQSADFKATVIKRHLVDKVPVPDLCDEYKLQPSVIYSWLQLLYTNMATAAQGSAKTRANNNREQELIREVDALKARLVKKDSVIAEISTEIVALKKEFGEP
jgi:transposase